MREILFRGKAKFRPNWVCGWYCGKTLSHDMAATEECSQIIDHKTLYWHTVLPETVGQFTGLTDKNGKKIFEGDICEVCLDPEICVGKVIWDDKIASYNILFNDGKCILPLDLWLNRNNPVWISVIGNIHDNPELLEVEA